MNRAGCLCIFSLALQKWTKAYHENTGEIFLWQALTKRALAHTVPRPCLKNGNTPNWQVFSRRNGAVFEIRQDSCGKTVCQAKSSRTVVHIPIFKQHLSGYLKKLR